MKLLALIAAWLTLALPPKSAPVVPDKPVPVLEPHRELLMKQARRRHARHMRHLRYLRHMRRIKRRLRVRHLRLVRAALSQRGVPYVWGGESRWGFDCSGLMQWAYRRIGVLIGRTTSVQRYAGRAVSLWGHLKLGDLIFADGGGHVGMYVGAGRVVEAPHTGDVVKVVSISYFGAEFARRILR